MGAEAANDSNKREASALTTSNNDIGTRAKKLRSSDPDLTVIVGSGSGSGNGHDSETETRRHRYYYVAANLAAKSKYIDTLLSMPMIERESRVISFPDIDPSTWNEMMKFIDDPVATRQMNMKDVLKVVKYYDKYEFHNGKSLCNVVLSEYFKTIETSLEKEENCAPLNVDDIIEALLLASDTNLDSACVDGMNYIWKKLLSQDIPYGRSMFTEEHMQKLEPLLQKFPDPRSCHFSLKYYAKPGSPKFAERFVTNVKGSIMGSTLHSCFSHIELSGTNCKADGRFIWEDGDFFSARDRKVNWGGIMHTFTIELIDLEGWAIVRHTLPDVDEDGDEDYDSVVSTPCWVAPCSKNLPLPLNSGWKRVDPLASGDPKIKYILRKEGKLCMGWF